MKNRIGEKAFDTINIFVLSFLSFITFYPFYYVLIYSISSPDRAMRGVFLYPEEITLVNYIQIFTRNNLSDSVMISTSRTVIGTLLTVICCSMFAYGVSKELLPFRKLMYRMTIITMYLSTGLIPWFVTMKKLGLQNNFLAYILPMIMVAFYIVLIKTYFEQLPVAIEESAMVDGANYFTIFRSIVLPVSSPILATVAIFAAVMQWNSWQDNLYLNSSPKLQTLQLLLYNFLNEQQANMNVNDANVASGFRVTPTSIRMTITVIVLIPVFAIYPFLQKYFLKGIMIGSVKG